jgi:hypothetical protein
MISSSVRPVTSLGIIALMARTVERADREYCSLVRPDDSSGGIMEGVNVFDAQDKLRQSEFLRQGIITRDIIQVIHEHFNAFLLEC